MSTEDSFLDRKLLPSWTYGSTELFALEMENLFYCNWLIVGHISEFVQPGDYRTLDVGSEKAIVILGQDNDMHAFHNVCRHRGSRVVAGIEGNCGQAIVCPFHGWTYHLDGVLKNVPRLDSFPNLDRFKEKLVPIDIEIWQGFIFVRFQQGDRSIAEQMSPVNDRIAPYRLPDLKPCQDAQLDRIPYNWKIFHDVDNEGYHVPSAHPGLQDLYGRTYVEDEYSGIPITTAIVDQYQARSWSVSRYKSILPEFDYLPKENQRLWQYVGVFPNLVLYFYPEKVGFYTSLPLSVNCTTIVERVYALPDSRRQAKAARYLSRRIDAITGREDQDLVKWLRDAISTSVYPRSHLSSLEQGVLTFHEDLKKRIPVMGLEVPPHTGTLAAINRRLQLGNRYKDKDQINNPHISPEPLL